MGDVDLMKEEYMNYPDSIDGTLSCYLANADQTGRGWLLKVVTGIGNGSESVSTYYLIAMGHIYGKYMV